MAVTVLQGQPLSIDLFQTVLTKENNSRDVKSGPSSGILYVEDRFLLKMIEIISTVTIISLTLMWAYYRWSNRHVFRLAASLKGPPSYPMIGSILQFIGTKQQASSNMLNILANYGPEPFKIWFGPFLTVIISKPEDIKILLNSSKALHKPWFFKFFYKLVGEGLFTAPVDKWRKHRRVITSAFDTKLLEKFITTFNEKNRILIKNMREELNKPVKFNLFEYISQTTVDTICETTMGYNLGTQSNENSEFADALTKIQDSYLIRLVKPWLYPNIINSFYENISGVYKLYETINKLPTQVIKEKKQEFAKKQLPNSVTDINYEEKTKIFLDMLLEMNNYAGANFSDQDLKDEVVTMMATGSETTALTSCFCLLMLAIHQEIQCKVYDEIYDVFGIDEEPMTIEHVNKLGYLEQVILETLRLYPAVPNIPRKVQGDLKISNYMLPKGTTVIISAISVHRNPKFYIKPLDFNPENFNQENVAKRPKYNFIPFSGGARNCIGSKYATLSIKLLIIKFLKHFSVHTDLKLSDVQVEIDMVLKSTIGFPVTIRSREIKSTFNRNVTSINNDETMKETQGMK